MAGTYTIRFQPAHPHPGGDVHGFQPCLLVDDDSGSVPGRVFVVVTGSAATIAKHRISGDDEALNMLILTYGVDRLTKLLSQPNGAANLFGPNETQEWKITGDDVDELLSVAGPKACDYQITEQRDLYCAAASKDDKTRVGSAGIHMVAPTSQAICGNCALPDGRVLCSHLSHPSVAVLQALGAPTSRFLGSALCAQGEAGISVPQECRAGGHDCWRRVIEEPAPLLIRSSPLSLPEALDFLDATWRLATKKSWCRLIRLRTQPDWSVTARLPTSLRLV